MSQVWWQPLVLLLCSALAACGAPGTADVRPIPVGCAAVHTSPRGPVCDLDFERDGAPRLRLMLTVPNDAQVRVLFGGALVPGSEALLDQGARVLSVFPRRGASALWLLVGRGPLSFTLHRVPLGEVRHPAWLREARRLWVADQQDEAVKVLLANLAGQEGQAAHAIGVGYLGRIHKELGAMAKARAEISQSLRELRLAGLVSVEFTNVMELAALVRDQDRDPRKAQELLDERLFLVPQQPEIAAWLDMHRSWNLQAQGDLRGALRALDSGIKTARRCGDEMALSILRLQRVDILRTMGRSREVLADLGATLAAQTRPCWLAQVQAAVGQSQVAARDAGPQGDVVPMDPRAPLNQALLLVESVCHKADLESDIVADLARAEVQDQRFDVAQGHARRLRQILAREGGGDQRLRLVLLELDGEIALGLAERAQGRGEPSTERFAEARGSFARLLKDAALPDERETRWRALLGLARASERSDPRAAQDLYRQAEEHLDRRSQDLPLGAGRGSFLGQHERGTRYYADFLWRRRELAEAMRVLRSARTRGLRALVGLGRAAALVGGQRDAWAAALASYQGKRQLVHSASAALRDAPRKEQDERREALQRATDDALRALEVALDTVAVSGPPALAPPASGEALLICHPRRVGHLCLLEDAEGVSAADVANLSPKAPPEALGQALLSPFAARLRGLRRLRVLAFGALRQIDVHRLPFQGHPLEELPPASPGAPGLPGLEVVYALDLPLAAVQKGERREPPAPRAVLLFDPTDDIPRSTVDPAGQRAAAALRRQGLAVDYLYGSGAKHGTWGRQEAGAPPRDLWTQGMQGMQGLQAAVPSLLLYLGHSTTSAGWHQRIGSTEESGVMISDILLGLRRGPALALLATCEGGLAAEETGGAEALSLATAFLLHRDTQLTIAPTRAVSPEVAAEVAAVLSERGPAALAAAPTRALHQALAQVRRSRQERGQRPMEDELASFRVFVR